jgi:hypothetical protein
MLLPARVPLGITRGRIPTGPRVPPPPLPPAPLLTRGRAGSTGVAIEEVVREMVVAYKTFVRGEGCAKLLQKMDGEWRHVLRLMAADLMDEGLSGAGFVRHACEGVRRLTGRRPWPSDVFRLKALASWLPSYRTSSVEKLGLDGYVATPERRKAHQDRIAACRAPA